MTESTTTFSSLGISDSLVSHINTLGICTPTPIQEQAIPLFFQKSCDVIGQAQTGTGKTAAFGLPIIDSIDSSQSCVQALILSPTRELALQISKVLQEFSKPYRYRVTTIYGGQSFTPQIKALRAGPQIVVGTPGRVVDMLKRGELKVNAISYLVIDEADEMMKFGFLEELEDIFKFTPKEKRSLLFSATMPKQVAALATRYMNDPVHIQVKPKYDEMMRIQQRLIKVSEKSKLEALKRVIDCEENFYGLIFCNTKKQTDEVALQLINLGYACDCLHGDLTQGAREKVLHKFRKKKCTILVVTDVVARGIDIPSITHVINWGTPQDLEAYTHRIGRTGRGGETGVAITLLSNADSYRFRMIQRQFKFPIEEMPIPEVNDILKKQHARLLNRVQSILDDGVDTHYKDVADQLLETGDPASLLAAALQSGFSTSLSADRYDDIYADKSRGGNRDRDNYRSRRRRDNGGGYGDRNRHYRPRNQQGQGQRFSRQRKK